MRRFRGVDILGIGLSCFLLGMAIEVTVTACSFSWTPDQFGPPTTSPDLYVLATVLTIVPFLGYAVFANFALAFICTFQGSAPFLHRWFYQLVGMAIFDIGMIVFMVADA